MAFDLDDTLTESKSKIDQHMAGLLGELLAPAGCLHYYGWQFEQIEAQVLQYLNAPPPKLAHLHIIPTYGALLGMGKRRLAQALYGEPDRG